MEKIFKYIILLGAVVFTFSCEKQVTTSPIPQPVPLGFLSISSTPSSAKIYIDGRNTGLVTPDSLNWLEEKTHQVTLKLKYYRDTVFTVDIDKKNPKYLDIDYLSNPKMLGKILVHANVDNASIFLDDSATGRVTPDTIYNLIPGYYNVRITAPEHREKSNDYLVTSNVTADAVFFLKDTSVWVDYSMATSPISDNYLTSIAVDRNNVVWMGTLASGIVSFNGVDWTAYNADNSPLPSDQITDLEVDSTNNLWIATLEGAVRYDGTVWEQFNMSNKPMKSNHVTCIKISDENVPWIGTTEGLLTYGNNWYNIDSTKFGLAHKWVTAMDIDEQGNLWVGSLGFGVSKRSPDGSWVKYRNYWQEGEESVLVSFPSNRISAVAAWRNSVWLGHLPDPITTLGGLTNYTGANWRLDFSPMPSNIIYNIKIEENNRKWVCTQEGLLTFIRFFESHFFTLENSGLDVKVIKDVAFDRKTNFVWVATYGGGLYKFKRDFE